MVPVLVRALEGIGREARVHELEDIVAREMNLSSDQLSIGHDKSRTEFQYRLAWARTYAKKDGLVDSPGRNRWIRKNSTTLR